MSSCRLNLSEGVLEIALFVLQKHSPRIPPEVIQCVYTTLNMKNELLWRGGCLKYWEKYGRNTLPYPLALRSGTEALPPAPASSRPERLSAERFSDCWAKAVSNNRAFLQLAQSPPWDFGTAGVKSARSKTTPILRGGEKKGSVCLQLALGSLNQASLRCLAAGTAFSPPTFSFLSLGEERMEKFIRKRKLQK